MTNLENLMMAEILPSRRDIFKACSKIGLKEGIVCEFGVYMGRSLRMLREFFKGEIVAFDSTLGLPEAWVFSSKKTLPKGSMECEDYVHAEMYALNFQKGMFKDTVAKFFSNTDRKIKFASIDCDIYSSTKEVLEGIKKNVTTGTILYFDELSSFEDGDYDNWEMHEFKALTESGIEYKPLFRTKKYECAVEVISEKHLKAKEPVTVSKPNEPSLEKPVEYSKPVLTPKQKEPKDKQ